MMGVDPMYSTFLAILSYRDDDGKCTHYHYAVSAGDEHEVLKVLEQKFGIDGLACFSVSSIRSAGAREAAQLGLAAGTIRPLGSSLAA
jgi:hypothetical protein